MTLADIAVKRPIFISCLVIAMLVVGYISFKKLGVDMLPNVSFPVVMVTTPYPGAAPSEIETLVSKVLEDEISNVPGLKSLKSINKEGVSIVVADFTLETDIKYAEQQIRDRVSSAKRKLPDDVDESVIRKLSPSDMPILYVSVSADLPPDELYDLANETIRPKLEQVPQVGLVEIIGGRKREIRIELDRDKLKSHEISATHVATRLAATGRNIPVGKVDEGNKENVFRVLGQFSSLKDIESTVVNFLGNDVPVMVKDVGRVVDSLRDEKSRSYVNGKKSLFLLVFKQSGANTVAVVDAIKLRLDKINAQLSSAPGKPILSIVRDLSKFVRLNVEDVKESILLGISLTIIVVFLFLGSGRSTIITGLALPNSLMGAFILMYGAGFTINSMTLLAMSLAVGLLIDDAIVVRENIFRHIEGGKTPKEAALIGTKEVTLAVVATTLAVLSVFGPVGFLKGVVGQFFKEFALTICFAMSISLFDALTIAPMLSAYFAGMKNHQPSKLWSYTLGLPLRPFAWLERQQSRLYQKILVFTLQRPWVIIIATLAIVVLSVITVAKVPKTFLSPQDFGEFSVVLEMPPGTTLDKMDHVAKEIDQVIRANKEVVVTTLIIGSRDGETNVAEFTIQLVPPKQRSMNTSQFKEMMREQLKPFSHAKPKVTDVDFIGGGLRPFNINIVGFDLQQLETYTVKLFEKLKSHPALKDVDISHKHGKPEVQIALDKNKAARLGISSSLMGQELRTQIEGQIPAVFRDQGREFDIRVRLLPEQRNLKTDFNKTFVPNINHTLLRLSEVAKMISVEGPSTINRQDRARYIQISSDITPGGPGMGAAMKDISEILKTELPLPPGISYAYVGQAESFQELIENIIVAFILAIVFTYLVLASLYESFITPFTIMLVLPLAMCGAFIALFVARSSFDINSMIGCILLIGLATKNSILLVDYANQEISRGVDRKTALLNAGRTRLRPILMTTVALIAGMLPIAIGLNEASKQRTSMGIAVIGGLISSTLLTLVVIPAAFIYIDSVRGWVRARLFGKIAN